MITGHGNVKIYLHKCKIIDSPKCPSGHNDQTTDHILLECTLLNKERDSLISAVSRGELSYLAPLGSENISAPYFKQCFFQGGGFTPQTESKTTPPSRKTEITNILFYILNFASIIKFKM